MSAARNSLWSGSRLTNRLSRLKHFRGRGIHSPFVYILIREVLINNKLGFAAEHSFFKGIENKRTAKELSQLALHCKYKDISIDEPNGKDMIIFTLKSSDSAIYEAIDSATNSGTAIVIISPYKRRDLCNRVIKESRSTSIDRFDYLIIFNNHLPKQHFKL